MKLICRFLALLSVLCFSKVSLAQEVQLIYFTDAHQLYELDDIAGGRGGVARLKYVVDQAKQYNKELLTIHGGDFVGGVLYGGIYKGKNMVKAFNKIPVDIFNFGQHEFDYGLDHLIELIKESNGQFFTSNLVQSDRQPLNRLPKELVRTINNRNLLFIGLTDQMSTTKQDPRVHSEDLLHSVQSILEKHRDTPLDYIIVLTQMDLEKNRELVNTFPQISLILTEEVNEYESQINYVGPVPIIATSGNMSSVAKVTFKDHSFPIIEIIPLDKHTPKDSHLEKLESEERISVKALLNENLGELQVDLNAIDGLTRESLAGNLVTDALRDTYHTDFALIDGSGIRNNISKGIFTLEKARSLLPFGNKIIVVMIQGKDLKEYIKSQLLGEKSKLIQVSGFSYRWDKNNKEVIFPTIQDTEFYTLALNDYNFQKLSSYKSVLIDANDPKSLADYQVLKSYLKEQKVINPTLSKRIIIVENN